MEITGSRATIEVLTDRVSTWFMDRLVRSVKVRRLTSAGRAWFSFTLSNTTMVS